MAFCKELGIFVSERLELNGLIVSLNGQFVFHRTPYRMCLHVARINLIVPCMYMRVEVRFPERRCVFSLLHSGQLGVHTKLFHQIYNVVRRGPDHSSAPGAEIKSSGAISWQRDHSLCWTLCHGLLRCVCVCVCVGR